MAQSNKHDRLREVILVGPNRRRMEAEARILRKLLGVAVRVTGHVASCYEDQLIITSKDYVVEGPCRKVSLPHVSLARILGYLIRTEGWKILEEDDETILMKATNTVLRVVYDGENDYLGLNIGDFVSIGSLKIPLRPPPVLIMSEVYVNADAGRVASKVYTRVSEGAHIIVLGARPGYTMKETMIRVLRKASKDIDVPVFVDPAGIIDIEEAYMYEARGWMSLTPEELSKTPEYLRGSMAFVMIPRIHGLSADIIRQLATALYRARDLGYKLVILDPVARPLVYPGFIESLIAAKSLSKTGVPIMLGINNVYELMDADTTGTIPLLIGLAAEAGASLVLVSEESSKALGATIEARIASDLVSVSLALETPPKDYPLRLLVAKGKKLW